MNCSRRFRGWMVSVVIVAVLGVLTAAPAQADSPASPYTVARVGSTSTYTATPAAGATLSGSLKTVVQTAANQLTADGGGTIRFGAGTFDLGGSWWEFYNLFGITFQGAGMGTTVITNNASDATDTEPFDMTASDRITIRDLTVRAGGPLRSTSDAIDFDGGDFVVIENVEVSGSRARGIIFDGKGSGNISHADDNVVRNCYVHDIPSDGVELLASNRNLVEGCRITNVGGYGVRVSKSSSQATQPNKSSDENTVRANTIDQVGADGIFVNSGNRNQLLANHVTNSSDDVSGRDGIRIASSDSKGCNGNVVRTNVATDNQTPKTQAYGLNISSALCVGTVVGSDNDFAGNKTGTIKNLGTGTVFEQGNAHPTVSAGPDLTASVGNGVALDGTVSDDGPAPLATAWSAVSGPGPASFGNASQIDTTAVFPAAGTYTLRLSATDGAGLSASDDVDVVVYPSGTTTLAVPITNGLDDGEERNAGAVSRSSHVIELVTDTAPQVVGLRFPRVTVPRGARVTGAYVQFTSAAATTAAADLQVRVQLTGDAAPISGTALNLSSRLAGSSAPTAWVPPGWSAAGISGPDQRTPGLEEGFQQVVSRSDWSSGNAVLVLVTGTGKRAAWAYDGNPAAAAALHLTFTLP